MMIKNKKKAVIVTPGGKLSEDLKQLVIDATVRKNELPTLQEQITDIQLALIEIYEEVLDG